ncbi:hypothetical protein K435DRAFT_922468 [Dendrothele bispora CBS 962.96]|uniref:Chromatin elongation factor spt5 n=1 Tax=Dendrothele bispora (strain CBS 962.96) TaxID=1314807 RepID=A0A4S8MHE7_DENBC|nr:hypothetical protein K435DRAFT_922468 [Dendrothele bispora CBS 962.96]
MSNPFVDIEAQVNDEEDWIDGEPLFLQGSDDEDYPWGGDDEKGEEKGEEKETGKEEDKWDDEDLLEVQEDFPPTFVDYLLERYTKPPSTPPPPAGDDALSNVALRAALLSANEAKDTFWRIRCKPGYESELVFDIMHTDRERATSSIASPDAPALIESIQARAFNLLCQSCADPNATIPAVETELKKILGTAYSSQWNQALSASSPQDPDEDPSAGLDRLLSMKEMLVPDQLSTSTSPPEPSTSQPSLALPPDVLSAFCVPTVTGYVYVEADLGLRPQDTDFASFLRNHKSVLKRQPSFYKSKTLRHNQRKNESSYASRPWLTKSQVWLERLPYEEVATLLQTPTSLIKSHTWKQTVQRRLVVLLVPRLPPKSSMPRSPTPEPRDSDSRKRKRGRESFPQSLFDRHDNAEEYIDEENWFHYEGMMFAYDLLVKSFDYGSVSQVDVNMDETTHRFFRTIPKEWIFFYHEKVEVFCTEPLSDTQRRNPDLPRRTITRNATVIEVEGDSCKVCFEDYGSFEEDDTAEWVSKVNLRKRIYEGDGVEVLDGEHKGRKGMVIFSLDGVLQVQERESNTNTDFWLMANICRVTNIRDGGGVPWLGRMVTVFRGTYRNYRGVVQDVHPPRPYFTTLDVKIPQLLTTITVNHNDVYDSESYKWLRIAVPLGSHQIHFHQASWDADYAPNLEFYMIIRQPPQPWIGKEVRAISKEWKSLGFVKQVERTRNSESGLRFLVELKIITAVYGVPEHWFDYTQVFDPSACRTGDSLDLVYPLSGHQKRYWQPLVSPRHIKPDKLPQREWISPFQFPSQAQTPPWTSGEFVDPFATAEASAGPSSIPQAPTHWVSDTRLVGKKFYARWVPPNDLPMEKQVIEPTEHGTIKVYSGAEVFIARPEEIHDCNVGILPKTNKKPMVAIRGEHTGKNLRQIHHNYDDDGKEIIIAAVYRNWALSKEEYVEQIEVRPEHLAEAPSDWRVDPNARRFAGEMKKMRDDARRKRSGKDRHQCQIFSLLWLRRPERDSCDRIVVGMRIRRRFSSYAIRMVLRGEVRATEQYKDSQDVHPLLCNDDMELGIFYLYAKERSGRMENRPNKVEGNRIVVTGYGGRNGWSTFTSEVDRTAQNVFLHFPSAKAILKDSPFPDGEDRQGVVDGTELASGLELSMDVDSQEVMNDTSMGGTYGTHESIFKFFGRPDLRQH